MPRSIGVRFTPAGKQLGDKLVNVNLHGARPFHLGGASAGCSTARTPRACCSSMSRPALGPIVDPMTEEQGSHCCEAWVRSTIQTMLAVLDPASGKAEPAWMLPICK
jgi:hypothetical protein